MGLVGLVLIALPFSACDDSSPPSGSPDVTAAPARPSPSKTAKKHDRRGKSPKRSEPSSSVGRTPDTPAAKAALETLPVKGRAPMTGYSREAFGTAWTDTNDNGCDTRNDILRRDLTDKVVVDCVVIRGVLRDPYSGQQIRFTRGPVSSLDVQIDHVVPMGNAWATGAFRWTPATRERFANDRRNLLAVDGGLNMQKSDGDAATWLPPRKSYRCTYVAMQVQTKQRYGLWVTPAEKDAMRRILSAC